MTDEPTRDPARSRFLALQLIWLSGAAFALVGLTVLAGKIDMPRIAGAVLFLVGLFDLFFFPIILARRWKTPPQ